MAQAHVSNVELLEKRLSADWVHLRTARRLAVEKQNELEVKVAPFQTLDTSLVVFGSLARQEFTSGSDLDWTLLVDGSADPDHHTLARKIGEVISTSAAKPPGPEGTFGDMMFSHELIHDIGGQGDTNRNTTRRLLLLLESHCVGSDDAYERVVRNTLKRYLLEDRGFWKGSAYRVPRFLQNDFARYWRTMAVDFAYKQRARSGKGWALRNMKLRMSRKLVYVSGLLACYRCHLDYDAERWEEFAGKADGKSVVVEYLRAVCRETPLEMLSGFLLRFPHLDGFSAREIIGPYNEFLGVLADEEKRESLDKLREEEAESDLVYRFVRDLSRTFRDGIQKLFFDQESGLEELTKNYGVF